MEMETITSCLDFNFTSKDHRKILKILKEILMNEDTKFRYGLSQIRKILDILLVLCSFPQYQPVW